MREGVAKLRRGAILCGLGRMALLCYVWVMRHFRIRFVVQGTIDGMKKCSFSITVTVDQMRWIRFETGMWLVDCVHSVEVVSRVVDVDGDTRKRNLLLVSVGQRQE